MEGRGEEAWAGEDAREAPVSSAQVLVVWGVKRLGECSVNPEPQQRQVWVKPAVGGGGFCLGPVFPSLAEQQGRRGCS